MKPSAFQAGSPDRGDPDPYPSYAWLRSRGPVQLISGTGERVSTWLVTGHRVAHQLLGDPRLSSDLRHSEAKSAGGRDWRRLIGRSMLSSDPPNHTRLRGLVAPVFSRQRVEALRGDIQRICGAAIDRFVTRGQADLVREYALAVPVTVIHELLGIPEKIRADSERCLDLFFRAAFAKPPDRQADRELEEYLGRIVDDKKRHRRDDVTTMLLDRLESGELRDEGELLGMLYVLLGAGHTTTVPFLGSAILRLLEMPTPPERVVRDDSALRNFLEEVLRHDPPVQISQVRHALVDMDLFGARVAKGDTVLVSLAAANRDPAEFGEPDEIRPERAGGNHLAFGRGIHFCLGVHLARLEGEIAVRTLFQTIPTLRLSIPPSRIRWSLGPMLRGPRELPVTFPPEHRRPVTAARFDSTGR